MLAERLKTTQRTVNRDLVKLQKEVGLLIEEQTGPHGLKYWKLGANLSLPLVPFRDDEIAALYLGRRFLGPLTQTFLWEAADFAIGKMRVQLGSSARFLEQLLDVFHEPKNTNPPDAKKASLIEELIRGCEERREVVIVYRSLAADKEGTYTIRPYELIVCCGTIYITGYSCKSDAIRQWKLERMGSALATNVKFRKPNDFEFVSFAEPDQPPQKVRILFDRQVARFVQEHRWHESEKITERPDGSLIVEYELPKTVFIKNRLLSYGHHAEVLEPKSLRKEMRE